ncbi:MAG: 16S rRNA (guanine(966)-N(2))-methyltransferase RsmD [Pseudomonadota bacterium]
MRIIGGRFRGKTLSAPAGKDTRPTTDRVRENLFNILGNRMSFDGLRVLDLFAGTGALGLEAMSRGAGFCLFVEEAGSACAAIRENIENMTLTGQTKIFRRDVIRMGGIGTMKPFDLVFADPPYNAGLGEKAAESLVKGSWLAGNAIFILEEQKPVMPEKISGFDCLDVRSYGDTAIGLFEYKG